MRPIRVVSSYDTAIDAVRTGSEEWKAYWSTLDASHLTFLPGVEPTWFTIAPIRRTILNGHVRVPSVPHQQHQLAFAFGVQRIENLVTTSDRTVAVMEPAQDVTVGDVTVRYFGDAQLDEVPDVFLEEVGAWALEWSRLSPKGGRRLRVQQCSQRGAILLISRRVAELEAAVSNEPASQLPTRQRSQLSDSGGDATATDGATASRPTRTASARRGGDSTSTSSRAKGSTKKGGGRSKAGARGARSKTRSSEK